MNELFTRGYRITRYTLYKITSFSISDLIWSFIGSFCGISLVSVINLHMITLSDIALLIGSFGATAVLIYGVPESPLAQPRNVFGGHVISAIIGVTMYKFFYTTPWLASALAVSCAIFAMQLTRTIHPPGGATALIATIGSEKIKLLGYKFVLYPVAAGVVLLLIVAFFINVASRYRKYPVKNFKK